MEDINKKIADFFKKYKNQTFKKGEILIRADEDPGGVFYLTKGIVKQYAMSKKGEELVVNIFKSNTFFPMSWAINQTANTYYFEALEESELRKTPKEEVINFVKNNPDILFDLLSRVYKGTDGILMRMVYLMSGEAYTRIITELLLTAKRFGEKSEQSFKLNISEKDLASQTGMARETVSREIKILKDKGLVTLHKNILQIQDISKLEEELNSQD